MSKFKQIAVDVNSVLQVVLLKCLVHTYLQRLTIYRVFSSYTRLQREYVDSSVLFQCNLHKSITQIRTHTHALG